MGNGPDFRGVYDRMTKLAHLFERTPGGAYKAGLETAGLEDPLIKEKLDAVSYRNFIEEVGMLELAGTAYDREAVLAGETTPVFFGSAVNNFGIQLMLDGFVEHSAPPGPRESSIGEIKPELPAFSGFIFKIQGNMNPRHRDKVAFVRVCSGKFTRDMTVSLAGSDKKVRLSNSNKLFGQERETVDEAYPGDIVGLVGHQDFKIGDTLTENPAIIFDEIPRFPPECFTYLYNPVPAKSKPFKTGLAVPRKGRAQFLPAAGGRGPAAVRGDAVPAGVGIRRGVQTGAGAVAVRALARRGRRRATERRRRAPGRQRKAGHGFRRQTGDLLPHPVGAEVFRRHQQENKALRAGPEIKGRYIRGQNEVAS
jgi:peptide subunit release factor RF-3